MEQIELVLHPVRMRVILAVGRRTLTTQQLSNLLPDVAQTTLYRHINLLIDGGILSVVRESKIRGTVERELALAKGAGRIDMETSATLTTQQQEQLFTSFAAALLADFKRAQSQPLDGLPPAIYTQQRVYLTMQELQTLNEHIESLLAAYKDPSRLSVDANAKQFLVTGIIMPDADLSEVDKDADQ